MVKHQAWSSSQVLKCDVGQELRFIILASGWTSTSSGIRISVSGMKAGTGSVMLHGTCHHLLPFSTCIKLRARTWPLADLDAVSGDLNLLMWPLNRMDLNHTCPLISGFFSIVNTIILHNLRLLESADTEEPQIRIWRADVVIHWFLTKWGVSDLKLCRSRVNCIKVGGSSALF